MEEAVSSLPCNTVPTSALLPLLLTALFMWPPELLGLARVASLAISCLSSRSSRIENADIKSGYWMLGPATIFSLVDAAVYSKINTAN